jgi:uncharacterized SAM-binding protein YcdF (DUF218 family)
LFFILSKLLAIFIRPITWIIMAFAISILSKRKKRRQRFFYLGLVMLVFFSNQFIANKVMLWWEPAPIPMEEIGHYDVGIVFTGVSKGSKTPRDRVYFHDGADRITHTLQLYNEGKLDHILISGGLGFGQVGMSYAANRLKSFLTMAGVPDSVITTEIGAVNTYENAVNSASILNEKFPGEQYLLITSAFHMKRSALCLKKQGIEFDEFPAGFKTDRSTMNFDDLFIPRAVAIGKWEDLFKEWRE